MVSAILIIPLIGALLIALCRSEERSKWIALLTTGLVLLLSIGLLLKFDPNREGFQFIDYGSWLPSLSIRYKVGLDGLSLIMLIMTTFITFISVPSAWK
ncbi:MAG: NADH-quinone oxidoreductase subunit M, partial [Thermovibrio sp.]